MRKKLPAWLVLTVICVAAAALLAGTNLLTKDVIAENASRELMETLGNLLPDATKFETLESGVTVGKGPDGNPVGYTQIAATQGFGGEIEITVAARPEGTIAGISVGGANFAETAGLGARAKEPEFQAQFAGKTAPVALKKDGGEIDALSGATVTSRAVIKGVNEAMEAIAAEAGFALGEAPEAPAEEPAQSAGGVEDLGGGKYAAAEQGFGGPVFVGLTLDDHGTISAIEIGDDQFNETEGLGKKALEPEFQNQFIGKTVPLKIEDIDAISGATVTTTAVINAINTIAKEAGFTGEAPAEEPAASSENQATAAAKAVVPVGHALAAEKGTGITVIPATEWENTFPDVYASYQANAENEEVVEYTEQYPFLGTVYEGYGFAKYYGSARGHYYAVKDLLATGRPHALANCFTCKTAQYTAMTLNDGDSAYSVAFESLDPSGFEDVGCFTCHANTPGGQITVTHSYLVDAMGEDFETVKQENLACGQCHVEYYFAPDGKATSLPYQNLASMTPDAMYGFYDGMGFSDWENPRTGVKMLKTQHPEMETFLGAGSKHASMFTCADCHMEKLTNDAGETYWSHQYVSPLQSETIQQNCAACHPNLTEFVHGIQDKMEERTIAIGEKLAQLTDKLAERVSSGKYTDEDLAEIRELNRKGQWYWDFVFVENSEGAHNSNLDNECLDKAEELIQSALEKVEALDV